MDNKPQILVIGPTHIDIIGRNIKPSSHGLDIIGSFDLRVGGTGFFIASQLAVKNYNVCLASTILPSNTPVAYFIQSHIERTRLTYLPILQCCSNGIGHIALINNGDVIASMSIDYQTPTKDDVRNVINHIDLTSIVSVDCNLQPCFISEIIAHCSLLGKPVVMSAVSAEKMNRWLAFNDRHDKIMLFILNNIELNDAILAKGVIMPYDAKHMCNIFNSSCVIVTCGSAGYTIYYETGEFYDEPAPDVTIADVIGCGDTFLAATIAAYIEEGKLSPETIRIHAHNFLHAKDHQSEEVTTR